MLICPNCKKENEDGDKFCVFCGSALEAEKTESPKTSEESREDIPPQNNEVKENRTKEKENSPKETENSPKEKKKVKPALIIGISAGAAAIILIAVFLGKNATSDVQVYYKDNEICCVTSSGNNRIDISSDLWDDYNGWDLDPSSIGDFITLSNGGKVIFYPDKLTGDEGMSIYYRETKKGKKEPEKLDSEIYLYSVKDDGRKTFYVKGSERTLYFSDLNSKDKIARHVEGFLASEDYKKVVYLTEDSDLYVWTKKDGSSKIASDIDSMDWESSDAEKVYYLKDGSLYRHNVSRDSKDKIASDVQTVIQIYDSGEIYFLGTDFTSDSLYYYDGKNVERIDGGSADESIDVLQVTEGTAEILYSIERYSNGGYQYEIKLAAKGKEVISFESERRVSWESGYVLLSRDGKQIYFLGDDEELDFSSDELYGISISNGKASEAKKIDTDVDIILPFNDTGVPVYYKNVNQDKSKGDLYINGKEVDYDTLIGTLSPFDGGYLYYTDWDMDKWSGTLKLYKNGKKTKIADDISDFQVMDDKSLLLLNDFSTRYAKGTLYTYNAGSKKLKKAEEDVNGLAFLTKEQTRGAVVRDTWFNTDFQGNQNLYFLINNWGMDFNQIMRVRFYGSYGNIKNNKSQLIEPEDMEIKKEEVEFN